MRIHFQKFLDYAFIAIFLMLITYWNTPYYQMNKWWKQSAGVSAVDIIDKDKLADWPSIKTNGGNAYVVFCLYDRMYVYSNSDNITGFSTYCYK